MQGSTEAGRGTDTSSKAVDGIAGQHLTKDQVSSIANEIELKRDEEFRELPLMAKLFDTSQSRSVASQLLSIMPMSGFSTLQFLTRTPAAITNAFMPSTYAAGDSAATLNAMGVIWHGYPDKSVLQADPTQYNDELCVIKAKERERSYGRHGDNLVPSYEKADPCALELTIAGNLALAADDKESPYYPKEVDDPSNNPNNPGASAGNTGDAVGEPELDEAQKFGGTKAWGGYNNGEIPQTALRELTTVPGHFLHPKASEAFDAMNEAYAKDNGGAYMGINESYRTLGTQQHYYSIGLTEAPPGTSNHGTALAADIITGNTFDTPVYKWLAANGGKFGFVNPTWAKDRSDPRWYKDEPWHWEYARKVE